MLKKRQAWFLSLSILVHAALLAGVLFEPADKADKLNLQVEYRKLKGSSAKVVENPAAQALKVQPLRAAQKTETAKSISGFSVGESNDAASVLGRDIGIAVLYPRLSRTLGEIGTVEIEIEKDSNSQLINTRVSLSAGYPRLDNSALVAVKKAWSENKLQDSFGSKTKLRIKFVFKLTGSES